MIKLIEKSFFIHGNVPSSKNSKRWTGRFLINSKTTENYIKNYSTQYSLYAKKFRDLTKNNQKPLKIQFTFYRDSRRKFDLINALQIVADLMVTHGWITDDNADEFLPSFNPITPYFYSKENPGVEIKILESKLT